ncbi:phosphoenolpyruvate carboxykinase (ATP) [Methylacidimicrobium cyclopophantes]|uniref:Phosphoenolpyruvate carboxykinase (ATP) n=1 Tax=Methylacidimicrobium cyclopophantes TaxID=1041766 RepID=A0A5E6M7J6_9BACT|nr:phosphoenolpyruvate carboxykinase (ATP) [Methylacidimicrobium cyclopophantes]VVM05191.1 phosphoenolpyruvate carboxykinase (ATP) [Methylacidimicrobium cyclopophantes]
MAGAVGLEYLGIRNVREVYWNLTTPALYEAAIRRYEGMISHLGPFVFRTGEHTGRLPKDKFLVQEPSSQDKVWWGPVNQPISPEAFEQLRRRLLAYLQGKDLFIQDCYGGADPRYRIPLRIITERAVHSLFARTLFIREKDRSKLPHSRPTFTILHAPDFRADPAVDGTRSEAFIAIHLGKGLVLIGGTAYAGEIKKSVFTILNYLFPLQGVLSMHCSANFGSSPEDAALFFGLSGTGKTTLSADPDRTLIGDDEHGWTDSGIFNFEGGCYAKAIRLSAKGEPEIYAASRRFGSLLENVSLDVETRQVDFDDESLTENTRCAYPVNYLPHAAEDGMGGHPKNVVFLTCDAFGVLPPVSRLTQQQALYHFLSGYTAKVAGTEVGVRSPEATFSTCFGAPFLVHPPKVYSELLRKKLEAHGARAWLVNTGWTGGPYGEGRRMPLAATRAIVRAICDGSLAKVDYAQEPFFGLEVPRSCPNIDAAILSPESTWKDPENYRNQARKLAALFRENFLRFGSDVPSDLVKAGPRV